MSMDGRRWAEKRANTNSPEGRTYVELFSYWLMDWGFKDLPKEDRAAILRVMEHEPEIATWQADKNRELSEKLQLNHPRVVWRRWQASLQADNPRRPIKAPDLDMAPGRTIRAVEADQARIEELEAELGRLKEERALARVSQLTAPSGGKSLILLVHRS